MKESTEQCWVTELLNAHRQVRTSTVPSCQLPQTRGAAPLGIPGLQGTQRGRAMRGDARGALPPALPASTPHPGHFCISATGMLPECWGVLQHQWWKPASKKKQAQTAWEGSGWARCG